MKFNYNKEELYWGLSLYILILIGYLLLSPGISGIFIFDDIPNLSHQGKYTNFSLWNNFLLFILEGHSGPTGRPISLASFYINDIAWPSHPASFIYTNILIHLLNGTLVFFISIKLTEAIEISKNHSYGLSLLVTAIWVLHPMHTTTVLYIIQRMTELSSTFMLAGIIFYLYGREKMFNHVLKGLLILFFGVGTCLILAILSKENAVLLVAYILVIEFFLLRPLKKPPPKYFNTWLLPAVALPFISIIIYLGLHTNPNNFVNRDFTLTERLFTEARILLDYLHNIIIPNMDKITIFHDDYEISKSLFTPWTTLPSIAVVIVLIIGAFAFRKKHPYISFGIAWFFAGHIIESTVIPLELYFEHRNYLPIIGVIFPISWYLTSLYQSNRKIISIIIVSLLSLNSFILYQNSSLWGSPLELAINWYKTNPNSERTRLLYISVTEITGREPILLKGNRPLSTPGSLFYSTSALLELVNECSTKNELSKPLEKTISILNNNPIHISVNERLTELIDLYNSGECPNLSSEKLELFLLKLTKLDNIKKNRILSHDIHYFLSDLYKDKKDFHKTMTHLEKTFDISPSFNILKKRISYLALAGLYEEALKTIDDVSLIEKKGLRTRLALKIKQVELDALKVRLVMLIEKNKSRLSPLN